MSIADLPVLSMLRTRLQWHQERQRLLAENVVNADTPNYRARDLAPPDFSRMLPATAAMGMARTDAAHIGVSSTAGAFAQDRNLRQDVRPGGNSVNLEDEMLKVASNQMDYQAAATLYSRSIGLIKLALSRR